MDEDEVTLRSDVGGAGTEGSSPSSWVVRIESLSAKLGDADICERVRFIFSQGE